MAFPFAVTSIAFPSIATASRRDVLWDDCRNSLGIARLLVQEQRPSALVGTACRMAVETCCRAALDQVGHRFEGDVERALLRLAAPRGLWDAEEPGSGAERLAAAEKVVAWVAKYLRSEAPERSWGY